MIIYIPTLLKRFPKKQRLKKFDNKIFIYSIMRITLKGTQENLSDGVFTWGLDEEYQVDTIKLVKTRIAGTVPLTTGYKPNIYAEVVKGFDTDSYVMTHRQDKSDLIIKNAFEIGQVEDYNQNNKDNNNKLILNDSPQTLSKMIQIRPFEIINGKKVISTIEGYITSERGSLQLGEDILGEATGDRSGCSTSLNGSGDTIAIGEFYAEDSTLSAQGATRVWTYNGSTWIQKGQTIFGESANDRSGVFVDINHKGDIVAIGAYYAGSGNDGKVRIYKYIGTQWVKLGGDIVGSTSAYLGYSLGLSSDGLRVVVGGYHHDSDKGYAEVWNWSGVGWVLRGARLVGDSSSDRFGTSVTITGDGDSIAVSAPADDDEGTDRGRVRTYSWDGSNYTQYGANIWGTGDGDTAGGGSSGVHLNKDSGTFLAITSQHNDDAGLSSGHVRVYQFITSWNQIGQTITGSAAGDELKACKLSSDGSRLITGSRDFDGVFGSNTGQIRLWEFIDSQWVLIDGKEGDNTLYWGGIPGGAGLAFSDSGDIFAAGNDLSFNGDYTGKTSIWSRHNKNLGIDFTFDIKLQKHNIQSINKTPAVTNTYYYKYVLTGGVHYYLSKLDSAGNGWGGSGSIKILNEDGTLISIHTLPSGGSTIDNFTLDGTDKYSLTIFTGTGTNPSEMSWKFNIDSATGPLVIEGGPY
jgi:hypothetical protein